MASHSLPAESRAAMASTRGKRMSPRVYVPASNVTGTGPASAVLAGVIAVVMQADPTATPAAVDSLVEVTAVDLGAHGKDNVYGSGRVEAAAAVAGALAHQGR